MNCMFTKSIIILLVGGDESGSQRRREHQGRPEAVHDPAEELGAGEVLMVANT
jgi:hypothetical protein